MQDILATCGRALTNGRCAEYVPKQTMPAAAVQVKACSRAVCKTAYPSRITGFCSWLRGDADRPAMREVQVAPSFGSRHA